MSLPPDDDGTVISFSRATPAPTPAHNAGSNHALPNGACRAEFEITGLLGEGEFGILLARPRFHLMSNGAWGAAAALAPGTAVFHRRTMVIAINSLLTYDANPVSVVVE